MTAHVHPRNKVLYTFTEAGDGTRMTVVCTNCARSQPNTMVERQRYTDAHLHDYVSPCLFCAWPYCRYAPVDFSRYAPAADISS